MARNKLKYEAPSKPISPKDFVSFGSSKMEVDKKLKIYSDGTVEAQNFKERDSLDLSLELSEKGKKFYFSRDMDKNTKVEFIPIDVEKQYRTTAEQKYEIKEAFAIYENEVKRIATKNLDRYKTSSKKLKKEIDKILDTKNDFIFTERRYGHWWNRIFIDSTTFGPYNYDTKLVVHDEISNINDLLVVRTGNANTAMGKKIVWVSPHRVLNYSGAGNYFSTGEYHVSNIVDTGFYSGRSFVSKNLGIVHNTGVYALSSRHMILLKDTQLKTDYQYDEVSLRSLTRHTNEQAADQGSFYYNYEEYQKVVHDADWDGVVPSGSTISLDVWSTNPRYIGFDGTIAIKPVDSSLASDINISSTCTGVGVHADYQTSMRLSIANAKKKFHKKLNKILISKGLKYKSKRMAKYERLLEKVAQNIYDGLSVLRNENVVRDQGLTSLNPEDNPIYYDGSSKVYDGTKGAGEYDHKYTIKARLAGSGIGTSVSSSAIPSSNSSSSSSSGGGSY